MRAQRAQAPESLDSTQPAFGLTRDQVPGCGMVRSLASTGGIQTEKENMQCLNEHLASYLKKVSCLEAEEQNLGTPGEGSQVRDSGHYFKNIKELRVQIFASSMDNACIILRTGKSHLVDGDFRDEYEMALTMCHSVKSASVGSERSLMTPISLGCSWRWWLGLSRRSICSWRTKRRK